ncbi:MAG: alpha/beta hydrolase family protein [Corynebacterium sp.]|nr:alpha/beta hydrolase family protein [Corynebacterium sp.]
MTDATASPSVRSTATSGGDKPALPGTSTRRYCTLVAVVFNTALMQKLISVGIRLVQKSPAVWKRIPPLYLDETAHPATSNQDYDYPRLRERVFDEEPRVERWFVESPCMRRIVEVQVMLPQASGKPAPMLYLLDGVTAPRRSGWLREGQLAKALATEQVTVVMPTEASGSLYEDWVADDPIVGRHQWDTFLTKELPLVMEDPAQGLVFNGRRIIGGVSMGASGAVRLAAKHPDVFHGVIGLSGCYSTTSTMGRGMTLAILRCVGAEPDNAWGSGAVPTWARDDVTENPEGLRNMPVYLFAADGRITHHDIDIHIGLPRIDLPGAVMLEHASFECTRELEAAMLAAGMTHQVVEYQLGGVHAWSYYGEQLRRGWEVVYKSHNHL